MPHAERIAHRQPFGDAHDQPDPCVRGLVDGVDREGRGHVDDRCVRAGRAHRIGDAVEHRHAMHLRAALAGRDPGDDARAVLEHLLGVKRAVATRDALHDDPGRLVDEDAHDITSWAFSIAVRTPSSMLVVAASPWSETIFRARSSLVPVSRMTSGTARGDWRSDWTMLFATPSQRVMPPKMLNRIARTCESPVMILSA